MSGNQYTSFFEEVQDKYNCVIEGYHPSGLGTGCLRYRLIPKRIHQTCPHCGHNKTYINDYKHREIHGGTFNGVPVIYAIAQPRHECQKCFVTFVDEYKCLRWRHGVTEEAEHFILKMLGSMPMTLIADQLGLSVQTIANRALEFAQDEKEVMINSHYRYLSMDEVFIGREKDGSHKIYWVLNDNSVSWKSNNIMISIGRTKDDVIGYLKQLKYGNEVKAICIDMWKPYKDAIFEALPNAEVVIDRFHVMKNAEEIINAARKNANCPKKIKDGMKKDCKLFLKYWMKLSEDDMELLDYYLSWDKKLEAIYYQVQEFMDFYNQYNYDQALDYLCQWESKLLKSEVIEELRPLYDTVISWLPYIMNYFLFRITNGRTEGKNNLLRMIDRMGFHYSQVCLQACFYSHDRNQELIKWRRHQRKQERRLLLKDKTPVNIAVSDTGNSIAA